MRIWRWFKKRTAKPSPEAQAQLARARRSKEEAHAVLREVQRLSTESDQVTDQLREHNTANRYDVWLAQVIRGGR